MNIVSYIMGPNWVQWSGMLIAYTIAYMILIYMYSTRRPYIMTTTGKHLGLRSQ